MKQWKIRILEKRKKAQATNTQPYPRQTPWAADSFPPLSKLSAETREAFSTFSQVHSWVSTSVILFPRCFSRFNSVCAFISFFFHVLCMVFPLVFPLSHVIARVISVLWIVLLWRVFLLLVMWKIGKIWIDLIKHKMGSL